MKTTPKNTGENLKILMTHVKLDKFVKTNEKEEPSPPEECSEFKESDSQDNSGESVWPYFDTQSNNSKEFESEGNHAEKSPIKVFYYSYYYYTPVNTLLKIPNNYIHLWSMRPSSYW